MAKRKRKSYHRKTGSSRGKLFSVIDKCIVISSKASAGKRMKALSNCVRKSFKNV